MLTQEQKDRIADYRRIDPASVTVNEHRDIFDAHNGQVFGRVRGNLAVIDRNNASYKGYAVVEQDGSFQFREGRYYR